MATSTETDLKALSEEVRQLRADFVQIGETLKDVVRHGKDAATAKAEETAEKAWKEARTAAQGLSSCIEEQPITSALTAFGIGVALGLLFGRR